ncbi:MAG: chromosomal replication initiator protein DnaA, partial [Rhizobiales bacterium]|nr:chromosomal replication initiator protein DnaA [Hyphomicrobiales bacterium]
MRDDRTGEFGSGASALRALAVDEVQPMSGRADAVLWERVKTRLRTELGEDVFSSWFARVEFEGADGASVNLSVPTRFLKSWIQSHYFDKLLGLWTAE